MGEYDSRYDYNFVPVSKLFEAQVEANPDKIAVTTSKDSLTYKELNNRANKIANSLLGLGAGREVIIGVLLDRCCDFYAVRQGILKSGSAFLVAAPDYPDDRITYIFQDSEAKVVITTKEILESHKGLIDNLSCKFVYLEDLLLCDNVKNPEVQIGPRDLCYCIYTSGSTGKPKGVMIEHECLSNFVNPNPKNRETAGFVERGSVSLALASMTFDVSIMEEFVPLTNGLTSVIALEEEIDNPLDLCDLIRDKGVDIITSTPSYILNILDIPKVADTLSQIKVYDLGAEAFPPALYDKINAINPSAYIMNGYGPTETTISCTMKVITSSDNITIGYPNGNAGTYIVDKNNSILPQGDKGELVITGLGVGRGYVGLPDKTEAAFITLNGERAYKSGDLARILDNGEIEFLGRIDNQIKLRGLRIELGEIEEVVNSYEGIATCITVPVDNTYLCCYFTADNQVDVEELTKYAASRLTAYMVPEVFIQLESMPLTTNGKIDKKALPAPVYQSKDIKLPETTRQKKIYDIVSAVIGNDNFGIDTELYRAGLSSIGAMKLCINLSDEFGVIIKTSDIHDNNTVEALDQFMLTASKVKSYEKQSSYELTGSQRGIFVECMKDEDSTMYNIPFLFDLETSVDLVRLQQAVSAMVNAHKYLLTEVYLDDSGVMRQKPVEDTFKPEIIELSDEEFANKREELVQPFKLQNSRLFRIVIYKTNTAAYLFTDFHHIIADGNSYDIVMEDIDKAYRGEELQEETYTGFDAAMDELSQISEGRYKKAEAYYDSLLDDVENDSLPLRDVDETEPKRGYIEYGMSVKRDTIDNLCEEMAVTANTLFTGLFGIVAARFVGGEQSTFTTIYNGRNDSRLEDTVCMLVKTIPVLSSFDDKTTIGGYFKSMQDQLVATMANDIFPFSDVAARYNISGDMSFGYQAELEDDFHIGDTIAVGHDLAPNTAMMPIVIQVRLYGDKYVLTCEYRADMYSKEFIESMLSAINAGMNSLPSVRFVSDITLVDDKARATMDSFNQTQVEYNRSLTIYDMYRETIDKYGDETAVVYKDKEYSYNDLDRVSDALAEKIINTGAGREKVVAILIPRCEYMAFTTLGVIKSGAAYEPLDPSYPDDRLQFMMEDAGADILILDRNLEDKVKDFKGTRIYTDEIMNLEYTGVELNRPEPEDLFIMLYTSGSTGVPKGCMIEYAQITAFVRSHMHRFHLDHNSRYASYASFGFDASMQDIHGTILSGARLYIIPDEIRLDLVAIGKFFNDNKITHTFMTTQVGRQFVLGVECSDLQYIILGGEKLVPFEPDMNTVPMNGYGPTECICYVTIREVDKYFSNIPVGTASENTKLYVTDPKGHLLPIGACGELLVAGHQVSRGYLNRPEKTKEAFSKNIYDEEEGYERVYHTGDVVRLLPDGNVQVIGRADSQVKIRGFRIELSEVEEIIRKFPGIEDVTVVAFDEKTGGKYVAAYIVSDEEIDIEAMNDFIRETKPPYMVPAVTMQIDAIPLTQNSKVNRRALPRPERKVEELVMPSNDVQQAIWELAADALGHEEFGITTDIFEAGLTSITSIKFNLLLSKKFNIDVKTGDIKENPTVEQLEKFVGGASKSVTHEVLEEYPLTSTQEGIFVECTANMGTTIYNIPGLFKLDKDVDIDKLKLAIEATIDAHSYIKTQLVMSEDGDVHQKRNDDAHIEVPIINGLDKDNLVRPYLLFNEQLFRFQIHTTPEANYLFLDIHHIVADGSSIAIILEDINRAYAGEELEPEEYTSYDRALDDKEARSGEAYAKAEKFFDEHFLSCGGSDMFYPDNSDGEPSVGTMKYVISDISAGEVADFCKRNNVTENVFFLTAFGVTLGKYNFKKEATFVTIYNGRNDSKLLNTVGMLVKTLPVHIDASSDVKSVMSAVKDQIMGEMDNDIFPFSEISKKYDIKADAMVVYQGDNFEFNNIGGKYAAEEELVLNAAKAPVSVSIFIENNHFVLDVEYRADMYKAETISYLTDNLGKCALGLLYKSNVEDIRLAFEEEQVMIDNPKYTGRNFVELFREAAASNADRVAVKDGSSQITYGELDRVTDCLATKLQSMGVGPEKAVGVLCGRKKEFAVGVIAVMKAGGYYVPLDPEYPQARIEYMMSDSEAGQLLVEDSLLELASTFTGEKISLDRAIDDASGWTGEVPKCEARPDNLAYMIYTSGSTGKPKGVMLEHRNLMNLVWHVHDTRAMNEQDVVAEFASFCFDASVIDIFPALGAGAELYIFPEEYRKDAIEVARCVKEENVSVVTFPTQMGEMVAEILDDTPSLRYVCLGGEKFKYYRNRTYQMINGYGPTENTVSSTEFYVDKQYDNIPIGKSQLNVRSYILGEKLERLPVGATGELCHAGRQVARGYHNLPEKTAAVFVDNPYAINDEEKRLYRTGDTVRMKGDGNIEYIGRIDNQVKIRGFRIELGEIEGALAKHEGISESCVTVSELKGNKYITAYYTGDRIEEEELKTFLAPLIPDYMMPSFFINMDKMPITPGGKIDKKSLPLPEGDSIETTDYVAPSTAMQRDLCEIFAKAVGAEQVGIDDNFFNIGGSSISASKVAVMCFTKGISIVYADLFKYPTVRELSAIAGGDTVETSEDNNEFAGYDYTGINKVIAGNIGDNVALVDAEKPGDVLITGATGFLGIHVLKEYLDHYEGIAYCLVRKGRYDSPEARLKNMLMYYFENPCDELFGKRIICIDGDITSKESVATLSEYKFDVLINCAACVKHFAAGDELETINVKGVENLIEFCMEHSRRLVQVSTVSVGGEGRDNKPPMDTVYTEHDLFIGQNITNEYIRTKFLAERAVLDGVSRGLDGKIVRVGNLMSRNSDGEFQINSVTNGFLRSLRGYKAVGKFPFSAMHETCEFSPIDSTALAVLKLSWTDRKFTIYHACNSHRIFMSDVIVAMRKYGFNIDIVADAEFEKAVKGYADDTGSSEAVSGLIAYADHEEGQIYTIDYGNSFTSCVLYKLGYKWPITDDSYLESAICALDQLAFFD